MPCRVVRYAFDGVTYIKEQKMKKYTAAILTAAIFLLSGCHSLENTRTVTESSDAVTETTTADTEQMTETTAHTEQKTETEQITETAAEQSQAAASQDTVQPTETVSESISEPSPKDKTGKTFSISFVGDTTQSDLFGSATDNAGIQYAFSDVSPIFESCDIAFANLETCVSTRGESEKKEGFGFQSSPDKLEVYTAAGIDIVSVANNHVRDFGMDALYDTFDNLNKYGIEYIGGGRNITEARALKIMNANGYKVGFVGYNMIMHDSTWYATDTRAGIAGLDLTNEEEILAEIREYDKQCDILIVSIHWGLEYLTEALGEQEILAHALADNGVDLVIGHHPHVLEPIEMYKGAPIFYSIGNFVFYKMNDEAGQSAVFTAEFDENGFVGAKMYPVLINLCRANLLSEEDEDYTEILTRVNNISMIYGTRVSQDGDITFGHTRENPPVVTAEVTVTE